MSLILLNFTTSYQISSFMTKIYSIIISLLLVTLYGCNSDEPKFNDATGHLIVHLQQDGDEAIDYSEYSVAIVPERGFIASAPVKDIEWPVEVYVGTYTIAAASPKVSETDTTESWYYGEVKDVRFLKDQTTEVTVSLTLKEYPKIPYSQRIILAESLFSYLKPSCKIKPVKSYIAFNALSISLISGVSSLQG